jgi:hypothetical protein
VNYIIHSGTTDIDFPFYLHELNKRGDLTLESVKGVSSIGLDTDILELDVYRHDGKTVAMSSICTFTGVYFGGCDGSFTSGRKEHTIYYNYQFFEKQPVHLVAQLNLLGLRNNREVAFENPEIDFLALYKETGREYIEAGKDFGLSQIQYGRNSLIKCAEGLQRIYRNIAAKVK